jgi:hypothetical protein
VRHEALPRLFEFGNSGYDTREMNPRQSPQESYEGDHTPLRAPSSFRAMASNVCASSAQNEGRNTVLWSEHFQSHQCSPLPMEAMQPEPTLVVLANARQVHALLHTDSI